MKDFDLNLSAATEADRAFKIRGSEFTFMARVSANQLARFEDARFDPEKNSIQVLELADDLICSCLNGKEKEWRSIRESASPPISYRDMLDVVEYILEVTSQRPTERSDGSGNTPSRPGTSSKAASSSTVAASKE